MKKEDKESWIFYLKIGVRLSSWIAFPVVIAYLLGSYLNNKFGGNFNYTLLCVGVAFFLSMFGLVMSAINIYKNIENNPLGENSKNKKK